MTVHHSYIENFIDDKKHFLQYRVWLLYGHKWKKTPKNTTKVRTEKPNGG